jgi:hypothetical protein
VSWPAKEAARFAAVSGAGARGRLARGEGALSVEPFVIEVSEEEIRRERAKAKVLRATRWWKQKLARGRCHYCDKGYPTGELTMDHLVPVIRGGRSTRGNVVTACKECNNKKKYLLPMEWEEYLQKLERG